jgi:DNA (cytosine-5)-methyltransferase 1
MPRLLDLFSGAGGCSAGYAAAGFAVTGVDIDPHPSYPYEFVQADVLDILADATYLAQFDAIAASPPCQAFTNAQKIRGNNHPDLITPTREALAATGKPYVIENVPGSPLIAPVTYCGAMFSGLRTYRHRLFESNVAITPPPHPEHVARTTKMGRPPQPGEFMHVVGNFSGVKQAREAMGIDWMTRDDLREAVPPAYTEHIGHQLLK